MILIPNKQPLKLNSKFSNFILQNNKIPPLNKVTKFNSPV
jgi:hypothetical protein